MLSPHNQKPEPSVVSSVSGVTATDLSRRTERTSYSIPEDGRPVTIPAPKAIRAAGTANSARIAQTSRTSLMIEFFEGAGDPESGRRPSLRVKVAPSNRSKGQGIQLIDNTKSSARRTERAGIRSSLSPRIPEENRLTLGDDFGATRRKSSNGDGSVASYRSGDSNVAPLSITFHGGERVHSPLANEVSREIELGSDVARAWTRERRSTSRSKGDPLYGSPGGRSRSVSRESYLDDPSRKIAKRRSRSLSRDRLTVDGKPRKGVNRGYEPKAIRGKSQSQEKSEKNDLKKDAAQETYDPQLLELIEDAIKRVVQPQLAELRKQQNSTQFQQTMKDISSQVSGMLPPKKDVHNPMVVLQPDFDKGKGQGFVVAGGTGNKNEQHDVGSDPLPLFYKKRLHDGSFDDSGVADSSSEKAESMLSRGLGHGLANNDNLRAASPAGSRLTPRTSGFPPYPSGGYGAGMPGTGHTPPESIASFSEFGIRRGSIRGDGQSFARGHGYYQEHDVDDHAGGGGKPSDALSIAELSDAPSTKLARSRRQGNTKGRLSASASTTMNEDHSVIDSDGEIGNHQSNSAVDWYFSEQEMKNRALQQHGKEIEDRLAQAEPGILDFDYDHLNNGQAVNPVSVGANPTFCPTPNAAQSAKASMVGGDAASLRSSVHPGNATGLGIAGAGAGAGGLQAQMTASAMPRGTSPMPEVGHVLDDDEITNPSIIQGPGPANLVNPDWHYRSMDEDDMDDHHEMANINNLKNLGGMDQGISLPKRMDREAQQTPNKDEGYISAANNNVFTSPGMTSPAMTPVPGLSGLEGFTDMMTTVQNVDYPYRGHQRLSSGNSHGMPSPLYDSSTGRGIDKIRDKDIVALMDHLTVRDAQRNARDTEILVSLVRSAAEMRNYFEDLKKQLDDQTKEIVTQVDHNTERSVQKLQGPRPLPPSAPRTRRAAIEEAEEDEKTKKKNMFRRALKGLSMKSSNDLSRIEEMLETLLTEVDSLKEQNSFYQQSLAMGTMSSLKNGGPGTNTASPQAVPALPVSIGQHPAIPDSTTKQTPVVSTVPYTSSEWQAPRAISPIAEAITPTPGNPNPEPLVQEQPRELPKSQPETPEKKRESSISMQQATPKFSRWSETTASTGFRSFFSRKNRDSQQSRSQQDFDYEGGHDDAPPVPSMPAGNTAQPQSPQHPPPSRQSDNAPLTQANRMSLEIKHPQPRVPYNHQLEQQAHQIPPLIPSYNNSTASFGPAPGAYGNPTPNAGGMTPSALTDGYAPSGVDSHAAPNNDNPHTSIPRGLRGDDESTRDSFHSGDTGATGERLKKKKDKNDPERIARRERRRAERAEREKLEGKDPNRPRRRREREGSHEPEDMNEQGLYAQRSLSKLSGPRPLSRGGAEQQAPAGTDSPGSRRKREGNGERK